MVAISYPSSYIGLHSWYKKLIQEAGYVMIDFYKSTYPTTSLLEYEKKVDSLILHIDEKYSKLTDVDKKDDLLYLKTNLYKLKELIEIHKQLIIQEQNPQQPQKGGVKKNKKQK